MKVYNDNSNTIKIVFMYPYNRDNNNAALELSLQDYLSYTNFESSDESILANNLIKNYIIGYDVEIFYEGDKSILKYSFIIPNPKILPYNMNKIIDYILRMIYNPYFNNDIFNDPIINNIKSLIYDDFTMLEGEIENYLSYKSESQLIGTKYIYLLYDHKDLVRKTNRKDLKKLYKLIISHKPYIIVKGNVTDLNLNLEINKEPFVFEPLDVVSNRDFIMEKEYKNFYQSAASVNYMIKGITKKDEINSKILCDILVEENLLHQKLRDELGLTYHSIVTNKYRNGIIQIMPFTNKEGLIQSIDTIYETIKSLTKSDIINTYLNKIKETYKYNYLRSLDDEENNMDDIIDRCLGIDNSTEILEKIDKTSTEEMQDFVKRLKPYSIYEIKGIK